MDIYLYLILFCAFVGCRGADDITGLLANPCDPYSNKQDRSDYLPLGLLQGRVDTPEKEILNDLVILLSSSGRSVRKLKKSVLKKIKSRRFRQHLRNRTTRKTTNFGNNTSSVFKAFTEANDKRLCLSQNLKLDYHTVSLILLHLNLFPATSKMLDLRNNFLNIMCRIKELISAEGMELPSAISGCCSLSPHMDKYMKIEAEYELLVKVRHYLKQKRCLYKHYRRHFVSCD